MFKRVALSVAVVIGAVLVFAHGHFSGKPAAPVAAPVTVQPAVADPPSVPLPDTIQPAPVERRETDPVEEHNRRVGRTQPLADHIGDKMVRIGDEVVTLHFKDSPPPMKWQGGPSDYRKGGFFEPLAQRAASGDDYAAHQLWQSLQGCREVPQTPAELREQMRTVDDAFAKTGGAGPEGGAMTLEQMRAGVQARYDRCEGLTPAMYGEALEYLREAADRGEHATVAIDYAGAIAKDKPEESRQRFQSLWEQGHAGALGALGKDSLPHEIAWEAQQIALLDGLPEPNPTLKFFRERAAKLRNETSPSEYNEAAKEAARLLRSNPNCCIP